MSYAGVLLYTYALLYCVNQTYGQWNILGGTPAKDNSGWETVGEAVEVKVPVANDDQLEDASDPPTMSEEACLDVLMALDAGTSNVTSTMEALALEQDRRPRGRCYRSRDGPFIGIPGSQRFCYGPLYVVYGQYRYCCPNWYEHPIVTRRGRRIRCRCAYDFQ
ncbi:uncharacterized protein LOC135207705 [Macrobrachium nipponense]|uniref:uncharacterized protein LOC135207705 n=1 Tax=Macrobrachium nipponense TaxID=159736 RepID=UPI0030C800F8